MTNIDLLTKNFSTVASFFFFASKIIIYLQKHLLGPHGIGLSQSWDICLYINPFIIVSESNSNDRKMIFVNNIFFFKSFLDSFFKGWEIATRFISFYKTLSYIITQNTIKNIENRIAYSLFYGSIFITLDISSKISAELIPKYATI